MPPLPVYGPAASGAILRNGGLREYNIRTPPDVAPNTRVIGLCGVNDFVDETNADGARLVAPHAIPGEQLYGVKEGTASPNIDGWFFSDFFLFEYLLRGQGRCQKWFTCVSPEVLVTKYSQYLHGNPAEHRRVVLDQRLLMQHGDQIHVSRPEQLRSEFLQHLEEECAAATREDEPVLVLIFSHGHQRKFGITCGGNKRHIDCPKILPQQFIRKIGSAQVTLFTTACFSGGWALTPNLNITVITAAGPENMSSAWPNSESCGRASGSMMLTAVLEEQLKLEKESSEDIESYPPTHQENPAGSISYAEWTRRVEFGLLNEVDSWPTEIQNPHDPHEIRFAAQDDLYEWNYVKRTGIPLALIGNRFNELETVQPYPGDTGHTDRRKSTNRPGTSGRARQLDSGDNHKGQSSGESAQNGPEDSNDQSRKESYVFAPSTRGSTGLLAVQSWLATKAYDYLDSFPGHDEMMNNRRLHKLARRCISKEKKDELSYWECVALERQLEYRNSLMENADKWLDVADIGLDCLCHEWDEIRWKNQIRTINKSFYDRYTNINLIVNQMELSPDPGEGQGEPWYKHEHFFAAALANSELTDKDVNEKIALVKSHVDNQIKIISRSLNKIPWIYERKREFLGNVGKTIKKFAQRTARSLSPRKRPRASTAGSSISIMGSPFDNTPRLSAEMARSSLGS